MGLFEDLIVCNVIFITLITTGSNDLSEELILVHFIITLDETNERQSRDLLQERILFRQHQLLQHFHAGLSLTLLKKALLQNFPAHLIRNREVK